MLTLVGRFLPAWAVRGIRQSVDYVELGFWMEEQGFAVGARVRDRTKVFDAIADALGERPTLYLEFGVFEGASLRYWSQTLRDPASELHAFDSFQGLPETFDPLTHPKGRFDVGGRLPDIDDQRIKYHVGWFSDTVPDFVFPPHDQLLINFDADLYSATSIVLGHAARHIQPGTILYFDDMSRPSHEPAAFADFMRQSGRRFQVLAVDESLNCAAFRCVR
jgi:hypothetical protein